MEKTGSKQATQSIDNPESSVCQLEARATPVRTPGRQNYGDTVRRHYQPKFTSVTQLYETVDSLDNTNYSSRLSFCRSAAYFVRHEDSGEVQVRSKHCGLRWCPMCATSRQAWISTECERWFVKVTKPRLVTLTLRHTDAPLSLQISNLYEYFRKFRKRKFFSDKTRGGVWFFHIKKSKNDHRWHPHLHMLIDSEFLDSKEVSKLWAKITGGSKIVHVKAVTNPTNSVKHAARYSAEPCDLSTHSLIDSLEVFYALHGRRIAGTWGTARMISFRPKPQEDRKQWKTLGSWEMVQQLKDSDDNANAIWKAYCLDKPLDKGINMYALELELYDNFIHAPPKKPWQNSFHFAA